MVTKQSIIPCWVVLTFIHLLPSWDFSSGISEVGCFFEKGYLGYSFWLFSYLQISFNLADERYCGWVQGSQPVAFSFILLHCGLAALSYMSLHLPMSQVSSLRPFWQDFLCVCVLAGAVWGLPPCTISGGIIHVSLFVIGITDDCGSILSNTCHFLDLVLGFPKPGPQEHAQPMGKYFCWFSPPGASTQLKASP